MTDHPHPIHLVDEPPDDELGAPTRTPRDLAERALLGAMLRDPAARADATTVLQGADLHAARYEQIWDAIVHLYSRGEPVDTLTVADYLGNQLPRVGGHAELAQLEYEGLAVVDAGYYAELVAKHAARDRLAAAAQRIQQLSTTDADIDQALDAARAELDTIRQSIPGVDHDGPASSWDDVDVAEILANGEDEMEPTQLARTDGRRLLYPAAVHSISGEPESGKSWVALFAVQQALHAGEHATYVDFEDRASRVIGRLVTIGTDKDALTERFHYKRPLVALDTLGRARLDLAATQSTLVVIDGVTEAMTLHGLSLMDNEDAARYLDLLPRHLADLDCSVFQIDHVVKDPDKQGRWSIGASHKLAGLDGAAYTAKVIEPFGKGKLGRCRITVNKDRPGSVREIAIGNTVAEFVLDSRQAQPYAAAQAWLEPATETPVGDDGQMRPTHLMDKISRYVEVTRGCTGKQIEDVIRGKATYVRLALHTLVKEGYITVEAGPRGAQLHTSQIPYREDADAAR
jgi:hypothetical protein